ncbi:MAG: hypothetical protein JWO00_342 [Candidatus Parcubacteria bacterium]|nr:hypothetical protein [Candidatus Parcubacteria bacterium]
MGFTAMLFYSTLARRLSTQHIPCSLPSSMKNKLLKLSPFLLVASVFIGYGFYRMVEPLEWKDRIVEANFGLITSYILVNKLPDGSYFFPEALSLRGTTIAVPLDKFKALAAQGEKTTILILNKPIIQIYYLTSINGLTYHAHAAFPSWEDNLSLNSAKTTIKNNDTISYYYSVSGWDSMLHALGGLAVVSIGIIIVTIGVMVTSSRVHKKVKAFLEVQAVS